jgi:hypothetical protein
LETCNNLAVTSSLLISTSLLSFKCTNFTLFVCFSLDFSDRFVWTGCIHNRLSKVNVCRIRNIWLWSVNCYTVESIVFNFILPNWLSNLGFDTCITCIIKLFFLIKLPKVNTWVPAASYKTSIIFKPTDWFNKVLMSFEKEIVGCFTCVKFINTDILSILASKVLTSMRELNFTTILDRDRFKCNQTCAQYVHHFNTFAKANHNMETTWMQS